MPRKSNKSSSYQYRIIEVTVDPYLLSDFAAEEGLGAQLGVSGYSEEIHDLRLQLMEEVKRLIDTSLTRRQAEVILLNLDGRTQIQIAEALGICQTTVHKTLRGNIDYKNGAARYGGAIKKLKKLCSKDKQVLDILRKINNVREKESNGL
jgi:DNA-binding CsgD family transcriptional regulator